MKSTQLKDLPATLRRCVREAEEEFHRRKGIRSAIRGYWPGAPRATYNDVSSTMHPDGKWVIEEMMILAVRAGAEFICLQTEQWGVRRQLDGKPASVIQEMRQIHDMAERQQLSHHPDRIEQLGLMAETEDMSYLCFANIVRTRKRCELQRWQFWPTPTAEVLANIERDNAMMGKKYGIPRFQCIFSKAHSDRKLDIETMFKDKFKEFFKTENR